MRLKPQQYWAIIITLLFHTVVVWLLFFAEMSKSSENNTYEIELDPEILEVEKDEIKEKIQEVADAELQEILSNKAAKRPVKGEQFEMQKTSAQLQEEFEDKQAVTQKIKKFREKSSINFAEEKEDKVQEEQEKEPQTVFYVGKSRVEYFLAQRYRVKLPIPVYKCEGGGKVEVAISVNRQGMVINAEVVKERSRSGSDCMKGAALNAALASVFSKRPNAPNLQQGRIVYQFAPQ